MSPDQLSRRRLLQFSGAGLVASLAGCNSLGGSSATDPSSTTASAADSTTTDVATTDTNDAAESVYAQVYQETIGSVVLVRTETGRGTGFVFDDGHVVTNAHVVGTADAAEIRFREGEWRTGEVVGSDAHSDLAAIAVEDRPEYARPLEFISNDPVVGQEVVVIGNPFGLDGTVTAGIVSGVNRSIPSPAGYSIPDAVQTDAAVNPGNSGGPIVSLDGTVVAVINSGGGDNVAFGISAALTQRVVPELVENGEYEHAYMGVLFASVTPAVAEANGLDRPRGVLVDEVLEGGPSDGVLKSSDDEEFVDGELVPVGGDVVTAMDDTEVTTMEDLSSFLALDTSPGKTVSLTVLRDGTEQTVDLTLGSRP